MSFEEYRASRLGTRKDIDGYYGSQCWDGYADYCRYNGVPFANCTKTGLVMDIWVLRAVNGMLTYWNEVAKEKAIAGDVIFFKPQGTTPDSHVGIVILVAGNYVLVLGQNQGGPGGAFNEVWLPLADAYPTVFRLKAKKESQYDGNVDPVNNMGLKYQAHTQDIGWREWVRDGQIAGSVGKAKQLEALRVDTGDLPLKLKAKVHIANIGWVTIDKINKDTVIGTTGKRLRIEAIELDEIENGTGKKLYYQAHIATIGWTGKVPANYATGTVGLKKAIEAIKIWLE
jgi:hypothetical protein